MNSQRIAPYKPLPPQRWGFLPTNEFWDLAALTPISFIFWAGVAVCFTLVDFVTLVWWQQSLAFMAFYWVWGGVVERYSRKYLAGRQLRALAGPRTGLGEGLEDAPVETPASELAPLPQPPRPALTPVPYRKPRSRLPLVSRTETWGLAYKRLFGRAAPVAQFAFNIAFGLAIFYPSWSVKLLGFLALLAAALALGSWERRLAMAAGAERPGEPLEASPKAPSVLDGVDTAALPRE